MEPDTKRTETSSGAWWTRVVVPYNHTRGLLHLISQTLSSSWFWASFHQCPLCFWFYERSYSAHNNIITRSLFNKSWPNLDKFKNCFNGPLKRSLTQNFWTVAVFIRQRFPTMLHCNPNLSFERRHQSNLPRLLNRSLRYFFFLSTDRTPLGF